MNKSQLILNKSGINKSSQQQLNKSQLLVTPTSIPQSFILNSGSIGYKAETDLYDNIIKFHNLVLHKHDIDKIKTDERLVAADYAIRMIGEKIQLGMDIIENLLKERLKFIQKMQNNEQNLIGIIKDTKELLQIDKFNDFPRDQFIIYIKAFRDVLLDCYPSFQELNLMIHHCEKYYQQKPKWKEYCQQKICTNGYLQGLLNMNLIDISNALYHKLKKYKIQLIQIHGSQQTNFYVLNDEQLPKLLMYLIEITQEFNDNILGHLTIIVYQWIEDITRVQNGYSINLQFFFNFLGQFESKILDKFYQMDNLQLRIKSIQNENDKIQKILKRVILPQRYDNYNIQLIVQIQNSLNRNQIQIEKTKIDISKLKVIDIVIPDFTDPDETYKPIGQFKGAMKINPRIVSILQALIQSKSIDLKSQLNELELIMTGVKQLFSSLKDLLVAEKKLSKAQALYTNVKTSVENIKKDKNSANIDEIYEQSLKLQKYVNKLSESANIALMLQEQLPKISEFIQMIQRFVTKQQFLTNDIVRLLSI